MWAAKFHKDLSETWTLASLFLLRLNKDFLSNFRTRLRPAKTWGNNPLTRRSLTLTVILPWQRSCKDYNCSDPPINKWAPPKIYLNFRQPRRPKKYNKRKLTIRQKVDMKLSSNFLRHLNLDLLKSFNLSAYLRNSLKVIFFLVLAKMKLMQTLQYLVGLVALIL